MVKHVLAFSIVLISITFAAQMTVVGVRENKSSEITFDVASTKFRNTVVALGFPQPKIEESKSRLVRHSMGADYDMRTKSGDWQCNVDANTGDLLALTNRKRRNEQFKRQGRTGTQLFASEQAAKNHLRLVATKCGVPSNATFLSMRWKRDGEVKDANSAGAITANYRFAGRESFQVVVDPQDGMFVSYRHAVRR